jgi:hypothetical protein
MDIVSIFCAIDDFCELFGAALAAAPAGSGFKTA